MIGWNRKKPRRRFLKIFISIFLLFLGLGLSGLCAIMVIVHACSSNLPDVSALRHYEPSEASRIFSADGELLGTLFEENRTWIPFEEIPKCLREAILAIEDSRFYSHRGIDPVGIARAIKEDLLARRAAQGASTITQQLARNIFLHPERSLERKIQEILLALEIERRFTKNEIMELYLNQIYFGAGAYGIEAAAQTYFGKSAKKLGLPEAALIAGLPAAPSIYSPLVDFKMAKRRQELVLDRMADLGFISTRVCRDAVHAMLRITPKKPEIESLKYPYFTAYAVKELFHKYDDALLYRGGLKIYTTLDIRLQRIAELCLKEGVKTGISRGLNCHTGALVAVEPLSGFIRAMVGGLGYSEKDQFNRAWQAQRQPGSAFKIFVYTAALEAGCTPDTMVDDAPISYGKWSPKNSDGKYRGPMTFRDALKWSRNVCAVRVMEEVGIEKVIEYAHRLGIRGRLEPNLSLALGAAEVTPLEMASAFGVIANRGIRLEPGCIKLIKDSKGNVIEDNTSPRGKEVLPESAASAIVDMMRAVIEGGTGTAARIGRPAAGKTGTTDNFRDAWFVGFTPQLSTAVWLGNDDDSKMNYSFGGGIPAEIWAAFMKRSHVCSEIAEFGQISAGKIEILLCSESKARVSSRCPKIIRQKIDAGSLRIGYCKLHGIAEIGKTGGTPPSSLIPQITQTPEVPAQESPAPGITPSPDSSSIPDETEEEPETPFEDATPGPKESPGDVIEIPTAPSPPN